MTEKVLEQVYLSNFSCLCSTGYIAFSIGGPKPREFPELRIRTLYPPPPPATLLAYTCLLEYYCYETCKRQSHNNTALRKLMRVVPFITHNSINYYTSMYCTCMYVPLLVVSFCLVRAHRCQPRRRWILPPRRSRVETRPRDGWRRDSWQWRTHTCYGTQYEPAEQRERWKKIHVHNIIYYNACTLMHS